MENSSDVLLSTDAAKRKALKSSVACLCVESNYLAAERGAVEVLTQLIQGYITEVGRASRGYCEMAQRLEPTVADVHLALIDIGSKYGKLNEYAMRYPRRHLQRQQRSYPAPHSKTLQVGGRPQRPSHIPSYLPSLPDHYTYIKTPVYPSPETDYHIVKERMLDQRYHSTKSLSKLLAKTKPSRPIAGEVDVTGLYSVLLPDDESAGNEPVYMTSLCCQCSETAEVVTGLDTQEESCEERENNSPQYVNPFLRPAIKQAPT